MVSAIVMTLATLSSDETAETISASLQQELQQLQQHTAIMCAVIS